MRSADDVTPGRLAPDEFYLENGFIVLTEVYHRRRGFCCGNRCRHCPYDHENVAGRK